MERIRGKWIKVKIVNKSPFYWGVGITCTLILIHLLPETGGGGGPTGSGNMLSNLMWHEKALTLIPGILFICNGLFPHSMLGKSGGLIYDFFSWVRRETKK